MARIFLYISIILIAASCREHFDPPGGAPDRGYLVVNGVINDNVKYLLHISTNGGKQYLTEYAAARKSPPVDGISWERRTDGVELFVDTHDPQDTTRYYRWEYDETWEFKSFYATNLYYVTNSTGYVFGVDYSPAGYEFLQRMKKNTENLGTLFDAQPSQLVGNIRCLEDPNEPVIGYIDVALVQQKRVFIKRSDVDPWNYQQGCDEVTILNHPDSINPVKDYLLPISPAVTGTLGEVISFYASSLACVDCTTRGTNLKPSFWP